MTRGKVQFWFMVTNICHQCHHHEGHDCFSGDVHPFCLNALPLSWVGHEQSNTPQTKRINWNDFRDINLYIPSGIRQIHTKTSTYKSHSRWSHELCDFSATHICSYWKLNRLLDFACQHSSGWIIVQSAVLMYIHVQERFMINSITKHHFGLAPSTLLGYNNNCWAFLCAPVILRSYLLLTSNYRKPIYL